MNRFESPANNPCLSLTRRELCAAGALGLLVAGLSAALPTFALADAPADTTASSGAPQAGQGRPDSAEGSRPLPTGQVAAHVPVPEGVDDVPDAAVEPAFPLALTDDQGRQVEIASTERVVVCMGSFAKTWQLAGGSLVGTTADALADYELEGAQDIASVGDFTAPNLEQILALDPTLVVMSAATSGRGGQAGQVDLVAPLEQAGIPVLTFKVTTFGDYLRMLRACCDLTGRYDLYRENGLATRDRIDEVLAACAAAREGTGEAAPTCLVMTTYSGGTRVLNSATQAGAVVADLGGLNVADENPSLLKDFSLESVVALDPDFVFALPMGDDAEAAQRALEDQTQNNPAWAGLTAVAGGRYQALDPALFQYKPLDAWDEAYRVMAQTLYGEGVCD